MAAKKTKKTTQTKTQRARVQRPSPTAHAADHKGEVKRGHDGKRWRSEPDTNGVYHWKHVNARAELVSARDAHRKASGKRPLAPNSFQPIWANKALSVGSLQGNLRVMTRGERQAEAAGDSKAANEYRQNASTIRAALAAKRGRAAGEPGTTCHHCKKSIAGIPVSHHSPGKPSKHYHPAHAHHHDAHEA
jgi:hypothetical protein